MNTAMTYKTRSIGSADTERLGEALGQLLKGGEVIELVADLGGGKTTFVRGLARGIGSLDMVTSPTFTLNKVYKAKNLQIHHFDFYRLKKPGVLADQLAESLKDTKVVTVVEWSGIVKGVMPDKRLVIMFEPVATDSDERNISISYPKSSAALIQKLETSRVALKP